MISLKEAQRRTDALSGSVGHILIVRPGYERMFKRAFVDRLVASAEAFIMSGVVCKDRRRLSLDEFTGEVYEWPPRKKPGSRKAKLWPTIVRVFAAHRGASDSHARAAQLESDVRSLKSRLDTARREQAVYLRLIEDAVGLGVRAST